MPTYGRCAFYGEANSDWGCRLWSEIYIATRNIGRSIICFVSVYNLRLLLWRLTFQWKQINLIRYASFWGHCHDPGGVLRRARLKA